MNFLTLWNGLTANVVADGAVIWCVNVLLQTTLVAVMALVVSTWFRQSPAVRYGVLCCGLILTLICPLSVWCMQSAGVGLLTVSLHSAAQPPATISEASPLTTAEPRSNPIENPPNSPSRSTSAAAMFPPDDPTHQSSQFDFSNGEQLGSTIDAIQPAPHPTKAISNNPFEQDSIEAPKLATSSAPPSAVSYMARAIIPSVLIVWLSLATLLLVRLVVGWMRVLRWLRSSERTTNERLLAAYRHACGALNISERIADLRTSSQLDGPIAAGWLHPIVVLPQRLIAQITDKQLHDILVHELAHIIRHDQIVVLLQNTAQAIFWLHPLVRRLNRQLAQAREEVCDNYVLSTSDAPTYSRTLLAIAEIVSPRRPLPGTVGLFTSRWRLEHRIAGLLDARRSRMTKLTSRSIALVTLMTITLVGLSWLATLSLAVAEPQDRPEVSSDSAQELPTETTNLKRLEPESLDFISDRTTVAGRVLDQAGNPIEDARIIIGVPFSETELRGLGTVAPIETKSAKDGTFAISYLLSELLQVTEPISAGAWNQIRHEVYVASIVNDLGADWYPTIDIAKDQSILLTLRPSRTLAGRLLDIEGNPVPKANLRLQSLASAADGNIEPWLASLRDGKEIGQATGEHQLRSLSAEFLDRPCEYTTDNSGRFEIPDIGQDQVATLAVTAPGIARQVLRMIAREVEPMSTNSQQNHLESPTLYGQQTNAIVVAPSQAIEGVVRDATTKEPLANVAVESSRVAGSNIIGSRSNLIRVASDENGRYRLEGLPKGEGNVLLAVPNDDQPYFMRELAVPVGDGMQPVKLDIELSRGVWLEGKVVDRDTQAPVSSELKYLPFLDNPAANAALGFNTIGGGFVDACFSYQGRYQTRRDGSFRFVVLPGRAIVGAQTYGGPSDSYQKGIGSQHIRGMKEDGTFATYRNPFAASNKFPDVMAEIDVPEDGNVPPIVLEAVAGVPIKIRVVDSNGKPVTGFNVSGKSFSSQWDRKLDNSEFEVTGLGPQDSRTILVLQEELGIGRAFRITPALDRSRVIDIALAPLATVRGRIIDKDDAPIAHARISALTQPLEDYNPQLDGITTDNLGNFHLANVPAGTTYRIEARTRDRSMHHLQKIEFEAQAGQTIDVGTYRADGEGKLVSISDEPKQSSQTKTPASASTLSIDSEERDNADALSGCNVSGVIKDADGKLVANAMVAVVAMKSSGIAWPQPVVLSESASDARGRFSLAMRDALSFTHESTFVIARTPDTALSWRAIELGTDTREVDLTLRSPQTIQVRLVNSEGLPQANLRVELLSIAPADGTGDLSNGIGFGGMPAPRTPVIPQWTTDDQGLLNVNAIPTDHGVHLRVSGNEQIAPQTLLLNSGQSEQRGERDMTYRALVANLKSGEIATLSLAPAQFFSGRVMLGSTNQPAAGARITMGASQQPFGGSSIWLEGKADEQGYFRICPYPGINFFMIAYAPANTPYHNKQLRNLTWESGSASEKLEVRLTKGVIVRGTVSDSETQQPLAGVSVQYTPRDHNEFITDDVVTGWQSIQQTAADGSFAITTPPGEGTLLFHAPTDSNYVLEMRGSRELSVGKPGGRRTYAHAFESLELTVDASPEPLTIKLHRGHEVVATVVDPAGKPVDGFSMFSRLRIFPHSPQWRGFAQEVQGSTVTLRGLPSGEETQVFFLDAKRKLGAMAMVDPNNAAITIRLQACGSAIARFVREDGEPVSVGGFGLHMVVSPGGSSLDRNAGQETELRADEDFVSNIDRLNHWDLKPDQDGRKLFPALIPGATYRFIDLKSGGATVTDFTVAAGEQRDVGEFVIDSAE